MKILYISQHFPPEIGAAQGRAYDMSKNLVKHGQEVTMLTTFPNDQTSYKWFEKEQRDGIQVRRSFRIKDKKSSAKNRLANYFSFMASSILSGAFTKKPDVVYATSPQLFVGVAGYVLSRIHRTKFVLEVRDLWVDFAELLSQFNNKKLLNLARRLERFLYMKADKIITVTDGYKQRLIEQGIPAEKIEVITNGVDPESLQQVEATVDVKAKHNIEDQLLILFAGNIGAAQGLDVVIEAAMEFKKQQKPVVFMLIGNGVEKENLKQMASEYQLDNIMIMNSMKKKELVHYYQAADLCLVSLKKHPLFEITIPSKVFDCMGMNVPMLIGVDGEARQIVEEFNAGIFFEPENPIDLVEKVNNVLDHPESLEEMKQHIGQAIEHKYNRQELAKQLSTILEKTKRK
ncbi:glycosyltransferase family 4 protein [Alkalihalobacterium alkalinitrilicum]|uniref:glycosyltransferase family 4 protein n=1 Tax=Alkalihalobacterium alkalinitrilicum TaxID=427920 RepID=UPI00099510E3|nr:glycosyltransferase family 4 protein [Alkalihalobacterium alkalinitrilicum]